MTHQNYSLSEKKNLIAYLSRFVTPERNKRFEEIITHRSKHLTVVLEDIYQAHNASAVLRSCDCFGIQDVHIIENKNTYDINPQVALGASNWLSLHKYNKDDFNTPECMKLLKDSGYVLAATTPHKEGYEIADLPLKQKTALLFGTEKDGLTDYAVKNADVCVKIPMFGFTESFNISVTAALCLYQATRNLRIEDIPWQLTEEEQTEILLAWYKKSIRQCDVIIANFSNNLQDTNTTD